MDEFSISYKLDKKEYLRFMMVFVYQRPITLVMTFAGIVFFTLGLLNISDIYLSSTSDPTFALVFGGIVVFVLPILNYRKLSKSFDQNLRIQELLEYTFKEKELTVSGESFFTNMTWEKIYQVKDKGNWILIYPSKQIVNMIPKSLFKDEQLKRFKSIIMENEIKNNY